MKMVLLEDCCEIMDSMRVPITASDRKKGLYPYYGANGIQDYVDDYIFDDELVLLAEDGGNFDSKEKAIAYRVSGKCWVNNHAHVLKPRMGWDADYVCYSLMFYNTTGLVNGATRQKLTQAAMRKMIIPKRSIAEQKEIAQKLNLLIWIKEARQQQIQKLDELIKSRFIELFGTLDNPAYEFGRAALKDLCNKITDGKHGGCTVVEGTSRYFIGAREIYDDEIHYDTASEISVEEFEKDYKRCNVEIGDLLIVNTGATIGKSAIALDKRTEHTLLQKSVALLKVKTEILNPVFLKWCYRINTKMYKVESASAQPNLLLSKINNTVIYVPDIELQNQFSAFVEQTDKLKVELLTKNPKERMQIV
jgi:type I restriction enzyme S subunit